MPMELIGPYPIEVVNAALNGVALYFLRSAVREVRALQVSLALLRASGKDSET